MTKRRLKAPAPRKDPYTYQETTLPTDKIIWLYARVSSPAQLFNTSMPLQTEVFVQYLINLGWTPDLIRVIDVDAGTSGSLPIVLREGMNKLYEDILAGKVSAIAAEWEDRLFREQAQIDSNRFIDACRVHRVIIITRSMIYDFGHPQFGNNHMKLFRHKVEHAAEYFTSLKKRMEIAQIQLHLTGKCAMGAIQAGYCVDMRQFTETGLQNPNYRKYIPFKPHADYIAYILKRIQEKNYNLLAVWREIDTVGPSFPTISPNDIPEGHIIHAHLRRRSTFTNQIVPAYTTLERWITNPRLIGHWTVDNAIIILNNHEPCVDVELFLDVFEHISPVTLFGELNPNHIPQRSYHRGPVSSDSEDTPTYAGLIFTDSHPRKKHAYVARSKDYYTLNDGMRRRPIWAVLANSVDYAVDIMLQNRLEQTSLNEALWQQCLATVPNKNHSQIQALEHELRGLKSQMNNLSAGLTRKVAKISPQYHEELAQQYETNRLSIIQLETKLKLLQSDVIDVEMFHSLREVLALILKHWELTSKKDRCELFKCLAHYVNFNFIGNAEYYRKIEVFWRDGYVSSLKQYRESFRKKWSDADKALLYEMILQHIDQIKILEAFPHHSWRTIQQAYGRFFNEGHFPLDYQGTIQYQDPSIKWSRTLEGQAYFASQNIASADSHKTVLTGNGLRPIEPVQLLSLIQANKAYEVGFIKNIASNNSSLIDRLKHMG